MKDCNSFWKAQAGSQTPRHQLFSGNYKHTHTASGCRAGSRGVWRCPGISQHSRFTPEAAGELLQAAVGTALQGDEEKHWEESKGVQWNGSPGDLRLIQALRTWVGPAPQEAPSLKNVLKERGGKSNPTTEHSLLCDINEEVRAPNIWGSWLVLTLFSNSVTLRAFTPPACVLDSSKVKICFGFHIIKTLQLLYSILFFFLIVFKPMII